MKTFLHTTLPYTILYCIVFCLINVILNNNNINFINWIYYLSYFIILSGFILGIFQLLFRIKSKIRRNIILAINTIFTLIIFYFFTNILMFSYSPEYIIIKDNEKLIAKVQSFHNTYIYYYKYLNPLVKEKNPFKTEYYSEGGHDPFKTNPDYINLLK